MPAKRQRTLTDVLKKQPEKFSNVKIAACSLSISSVGKLAERFRDVHVRPVHLAIDVAFAWHRQLFPPT
jgi:hypothetical protein